MLVFLLILDTELKSSMQRASRRKPCGYSQCFVLFCFSGYQLNDIKLSTEVSRKQVSTKVILPSDIEQDLETLGCCDLCELRKETLLSSMG